MGIVFVGKKKKKKKKEEMERKKEEFGFVLFELESRWSI